jgi:hypothetical protein
MFRGDVRALELGSDHEVFEESSFARPMLYFHDWPDVTIHTTDQPRLMRPSSAAWRIRRRHRVHAAALPDAETQHFRGEGRWGSRIARRCGAAS